MGSVSEELNIEEIQRSYTAIQTPVKDDCVSLIASLAGRPVWIQPHDNKILFDGKEIHSPSSKALVISASGSLIAIACEESLECLQLSGDDLETCTHRWSIRLPNARFLSFNANRIAVVANDSLFILDIAIITDGSPLLCTIQGQVECCSWGQHYLAVGLQTGFLDIYDSSITLTNSIGPELEVPSRITYVSWISTDGDNKLAVVYEELKDEDHDEDPEITLSIIEMGHITKAPTARSALGNVLPFFREGRVHRFFIYSWNKRVLFVANSLANEIVLIVDGNLLELDTPYNFPTQDDDFLLPTGMAIVQDGIALPLTDGSMVTLVLKHSQEDKSFNMVAPSKDETLLLDTMGSRQGSEPGGTMKLSSIDRNDSAAGSPTALSQSLLQAHDSGTGEKNVGTGGAATQALAFHSGGQSSRSKFGLGTVGGGGSIPLFGSGDIGIPAIGIGPRSGKGASVVFGASASPFATMAKPLFSVPSPAATNIPASIMTDKAQDVPSKLAAIISVESSSTRKADKSLTDEEVLSKGPAGTYESSEPFGAINMPKFGSGTFGGGGLIPAFGSGSSAFPSIGNGSEINDGSSQTGIKPIAYDASASSKPLVSSPSPTGTNVSAIHPPGMADEAQSDPGKLPEVHSDISVVAHKVEEAPNAFAYSQREFQNASDDGESEDSVEEDEINEERDSARTAFEMVAGENKTFISLTDVPDLFDNHLGTTYSEEDHGTSMKKIAVNDIISIDAFLDWYIQWLFGSDDDECEGDADTFITKNAVLREEEKPLSSLFTTSRSGWRCKACFVQNKDDAEKCAACETLRPDHDANAEDSLTLQRGFDWKADKSEQSSVETSQLSGSVFRGSNLRSSQDSKGFSFGVQAETSQQTGHQAGSSGFIFGDTLLSSNQDSKGFAFKGVQGEINLHTGKRAESSGFTFGESKGFSFGGAQAGTYQQKPNHGESTGFVFGESFLASAPETGEPKKEEQLNEFSCASLAAEGPLPGKTEAVPLFHSKAPPPGVASAMVSAKAAMPPMPSRAPAPLKGTPTKAAMPPMPSKAAAPLPGAPGKAAMPPMPSKAATPLPGAPGKAAMPPMPSKAAAPLPGALGNAAMLSMPSKAAAPLPPMPSKAPAPPLPGISVKAATPPIQTTKNASVPQRASAPNPPTMFTSMQPGTTLFFSQSSSTSESINKTSAGACTFNDTAKQKLSEASKQYIKIVHSMEHTLSKLKSQASLADESTGYDDFCTKKGRQFTELDQLQIALDNLNSQAGELLCENSKNKTIVHESRQMISTLNSEQDELDDYPSQPLDSAALERRKHLYEVSINLKGCLDQLENFISMLHDQDSTRSLLCHVVQMYKSAKHNASSANAMLERMSSIDGFKVRAREPSSRTRFRLQSPSALLIVNDEVNRWNSIEARFANLPSASPTHFKLTAAATITRMDKHFIRLSDRVDRNKTQPQPRQIVSLPQPVRPRNGWDVESSADRDKVNSSLHFNSPRELQSTSLVSKARDNLSRFSTTSEKAYGSQGLVTIPDDASKSNKASRSPPLGTKGTVPSLHTSISVKQTDEIHSSPDYRAILHEFLQRDAPEKLKSLDGWLQKHKGRETELFAKVAKVYKAPHLLKILKDFSESGPTPHATPQFAAASAPAPSFGAATSTSATITNGPGAPFGKSTIYPTTTQDATIKPQSKISTPSSPLGLAASPFANGGQQSQPSFGVPVQTPQPVAPTTPTPTEKLFNGKSARDMLTAFYQERNPSKLGDIDGVLKKYVGNEESLFANLAKKYNIDPSVFGIADFARPVVPTALGFGQPPNSGLGFGQPQAPGIGGFGQPSALGISTPGFGQPSQLGITAPGFGQPSPLGISTPGFGQLSLLGNSSPGFGQTSSLGSNPIGGATKPFTSPVFGGQSSGGGGFGALAKSPSAGFAAFGSPSQAPSPFSGSTPFGAPRR